MKDDDEATTMARQWHALAEPHRESLRDVVRALSAAETRRPEADMAEFARLWRGMSEVSRDAVGRAIQRGKRPTAEAWAVATMYQELPEGLRAVLWDAIHSMKEAG